MRYRTLLLEEEGPVAAITLDRPRKGNSLNLSLMQELDHAFSVVERDPATRAVVLTGTGDYFCTGVDLKMFGSDAEDEILDPLTAPAPDDETYAKGTNMGATVRISRMKKPVIAAINGTAAGAGFSLAMCCDIRIASDRARFTTVFIKRGLAPDAGSSFTLPRCIGLPKACELFLTGRVIDAFEADRIGLVNRVVPHDDLIETAKGLAHEIARYSPVAVRATKEILARAMNETDLVEQMKYEVEVQGELFKTEDFAEASAAFFEKREPRFHGR